MKRPTKKKTITYLAGGLQLQMGHHLTQPLLQSRALLLQSRALLLQSRAFLSCQRRSDLKTQENKIIIINKN
jgi:hypothetical protein